MSIRRKLPFKSKVFFGCLTVAMVPLFLSSLVMIQIFTTSLNRQSEQEGRFQLEEIEKRFSQLLEQCGTISENLAKDQFVSWALLNRQAGEFQKDLYLSMYQAEQEIYGQVQISIYDMGGRMRFTTDVSKKDTMLPVNWGLLHKALTHQGLVSYKTDPNLAVTDSDVLLQGGCVLENARGMRTGYLVLDITRREFEHLLNGAYSAEDTVLLLDSGRNPVYCSRAEYRLEEIESLIAQSSRGIRTGTWGVRPYDLWKKVEPQGFYILLKRKAPVSQSVIQLMGTVILIVSALGLLLSMAISGVLTRNIAHPVVLQQKSLNRTMLKLFQTQLNPHFLYNTLDSIKWSARIHQIPEIAVMAENLAVILRKSISGQTFVRLQEELETIESYICIQKVRFTGRFLYETEIPDNLLECMIPKMILQPLVENAIVHGLDGCENGYICIYGMQKDGILRLSVTDDGCGMNREMVDWINSPDPPKREGHLGLYNVIQILKIYYGNSYGLQAEAAEDGTTVTIVLPVQREAPDV